MTRLECALLAAVPTILGQIAKAHHHGRVGLDDCLDLASRQGLTPLPGCPRAEELLRGPGPLVEAAQAFLARHFLEGGVFYRPRHLLRAWLQPQKGCEPAKAPLRAREHVLIAQQQNGPVRHRHPARHMEAPGAHKLVDAPFAWENIAGRIGHISDDGIYREPAIMGVRDRHIERVAHDIDRGERDFEIDGGEALDIGDRIVGLDKSQVALAFHHIGLNGNSGLGDFLGACLIGGLAQPPFEIPFQRFTRRHLMERVDVLRAITLAPQLAHEVMKEDANPGVAGFGIGGDPHRALPEPPQ